MATSKQSPDDELLGALKQALRATSDRPHCYALVVKGPSGGRLLVSRKKILSKLIADVRKEVGSNVVVKGVCYGDGPDMVFECPEDPQDLWAKVARSLAKQAGLTLNAAFKKGRDDSAGDDADPDGSEAAAHGQATAAAPVPATGDKDQAAFSARLKALMPRLAAAAAQLSSQPAARQAKLKLDEATQLARQGKPPDWTAALALLDAADQLLAHAAKQPAATDQPSAAGPADVQARVAQGLSSLLPKVKASGDPSLIQAAKLVAGLIQKKDLAGAQRALEALTAALAKAEGSPSSKASAAPEKAAAWKQARQDWLEANDSLNEQLEALRVAILAHAEAEPEVAGVLAEIADKGLNALTGDHRVRLMAAVQAVGQGEAAALQAHGAKALSAAAAFKAHLAGNEKVDACEDNPWDVPVAIRGTLDPALDRLTQALQAGLAA